jgi:Uma2 family endonuclease
MVMQARTVDMSRVYTLEEYEALPDDGNIYELLEGKLIMSPPPGDDHGSISNLLGTLLTNYVRANKLGKVWQNSRFLIERKSPRDTEFAPDVGFITHPHVPPRSSGAVLRPPMLAVEVKSPSDEKKDIQDKLNTYLRVGVPLVWLVLPDSQRVEIYRPGQLTPDIRNADDDLSGEKVVPGFRIKVKEIFED